MTGLSENSARSLITASVNTAIKSFQDTLILLRSTGNRRVLDMWEDELRENYAEIQRLSKLKGIDKISASQLKIVLARPPEQWIILANVENAHLVNSF